jgi:putative intracellular protease/amidase
VDAGAEVEIASMAGGKAPIDPRSMAQATRPKSVERFLSDAKAMDKVEHTIPVAQESLGDYAAVFLPSGHGTMWDLPDSAPLERLLGEAWARGRVVGAVCHGPAGLVNVTDASGQPIVRGRRVAGFSNAEETAAGLDKDAPFLLETRLRGLGAHYESGPNFQSFAIRDGKLVTGQNPASSEAVAKLVLQAVPQ